ncbi:MAG: TonB-dependent receptor [Bacteroidetes bacterium]|nr:MAG: TonB-dependent receptor [Bacteroidota bacterium]
MKSALLVLLFSACFAAYAQPSAGVIQGRVADASQSLELVNVLLYASDDSVHLIKGAVTDSAGRFSLRDVPAGDYLLIVRLISYETAKVSVRLSVANPGADLGTLLLKAQDLTLEGLEITARKEIIQRTPQGFIFNAGATMSQQGGTATDVLRNTPTIVVDGEGAITLRGKTPTILINGRNSSLSNLEQIPASSIESIEVVNNPSAQFDADGEGGVINIRLKKNQQQGTNGAIALGTGYGAKGRINSSLFVNKNAGKWNVALAYDNRFAGRIREVNGDRSNFFIPEQYYLTQRRFDNRAERNQNLRLNLDYFMNAKNTLSLEALGNLSDEDSYENLNNLIETQTRSFTSSYDRQSDELRRGKAAEFALIYKRKFDNERRRFSANVSTSLNENRENTDITSQNLLPDGMATGTPFLQRTSNDQFSSISNFQADYTHPVSAKGTFQTGYKGIIRRLDTDFLSQDKIDEVYVTNVKSSNLFDFREQIHAVYGQYKAYTGSEEKPVLSYELGLRAEQVWNKGEGDSNTLAFDNQYANLFPNASLAWYLSADQYVKFSYGRRINRPNLWQINPFTDITDSLSQRAGNPNLKPEKVSSFEIGYSKNWEKASLSSIIFYRYATNSIRPLTTLRPDGVLFTQPQNFGTLTTYGNESIFTAAAGSFWDMNLSASIYEQRIDGSNLSDELGNRVVSWYGKMIHNFTLWKGSKLQVLGIYNSPIATPQGVRLSTYNADLGFQQQVHKGKGRLGIIATDIFKTQRNGNLWETDEFTYSRIGRVDSRAILVTFAYTFGGSFKEKLMENTFSND